MRALYAAFIVTVALIAAACGSTSSDEAGVEGASIAIVSPTDGATVPSSFELQFAADDFTIEPAGGSRPGAGHFHLIVDAGCVEPGRGIPFDDAHIHLGDGQSSVALTLEPGTHTLCLQAGNGVHTALPLTDTITVTVAD